MNFPERVTLEADLLWTDDYEVQRDRVLGIVGSDGLLGTFHVGSTAIPDVPGKPVLDLVLVFAEESALSDGADDLVAAGYELTHREDDCAVAVEWATSGRFSSRCTRGTTREYGINCCFATTCETTPRRDVSTNGSNETPPPLTPTTRRRTRREIRGRRFRTGTGARRRIRR